MFGRRHVPKPLQRTASAKGSELAAYNTEVRHCALNICLRLFRSSAAANHPGPHHTSTVSDCEHRHRLDLDVCPAQRRFIVNRPLASCQVRMRSYIFSLALCGAAVAGSAGLEVRCQRHA